MILYLCFLFLGITVASPFASNFPPIHLDPEDIKILDGVLSKLERRNVDFGDDPIITAVINEFTDKVLKNVDDIMPQQNFDPMPMPDITKKIKYTFFSGEFTLSEGTMTKASTLHREGDSVVAYNKAAHYLTITVPLAFDTLEFSYNYRANIMDIGPSGSADGSFYNLKMRVVIGFDFNTYNASLDEYKITDAWSISIEFHGHIIYDWLIDLMTNASIDALKPIILNKVDVIVAGTLKTAIKMLNNILHQILGSSDGINIAASLLSYLNLL